MHIKDLFSCGNKFNLHPKLPSEMFVSTLVHTETHTKLNYTLITELKCSAVYKNSSHGWQC